MSIRNVRLKKYVGTRFDHPLVLTFVSFFRTIPTNPKRERKSHVYQIQRISACVCSRYCDGIVVQPFSNFVAHFDRKTTTVMAGSTEDDNY